MSGPPKRHLPCVLLREKNVPCLVWFEDAIGAYGVPTIVFELYLLVPNIEEAENVLAEHGWTDAGPRTTSFHFLKGPITHRRLQPPGYVSETAPRPWPPPPPSKEPPGPTITVLLRAADWKVDVDDLRPPSPDSFVPPLPVLMDGLIASFLDTPDDQTELRTHMATQVCYIYAHCRELKTQDFAQNPKLEHRQFHYDALSMPGLGTIPFSVEQRKIRQEIREGKRQPQRNSWYLPPSRP